MSCSENNLFADFTPEENDSSNEVALVSDPGLLRPVNEDAVFALQFKEGKTLIAVADGMGGHSLGDVASWIAVNTLAAQMIELLTKDLLQGSEALKKAVAQANEFVLKEAALTSSDMGTTLTAALLNMDIGSPFVEVASVGDSRAYLISGEAIHQITRDHSVAAKLAELGRIKPGEVRSHPQVNVLYRVVGADKCEPDIFTEVCAPGDLLLLCSDGLWNELEDEEIRNIVMTSGPLAAACDRLVQAANDRGGHDNISVVIARVQKDTKEREEKP